MLNAPLTHVSTMTNSYRATIHSWHYQVGDLYLIQQGWELLSQLQMQHKLHCKLLSKCFNSLSNKWGEISRECEGGIHLIHLDILTSMKFREWFIWLKVDACFKMSWLTLWIILTVLTIFPLTMTSGLSAASAHSKTGEKFNEFDWRLGIFQDMIK